MSESVALTDVYRKTAAGMEQLSNRSVKLPGVARMALVIVDGIKPVSELHAQLGGMGDVDVALGTLELAGFIEITGAGGASAASAAPPPAVPAAAAVAARTPASVPAPVPAPAPAASAPASRRAATAQPPMSFEALRSWTSRRASSAMGPMGDDYCMRIERAKNREELIAAAEHVRNGVDAITNSAAKAAAFWADFQKNLNP